MQGEMQASPKIQGISIDRSINRLSDACSQNSDDERTLLLAPHTLTNGCAGRSACVPVRLRCGLLLLLLLLLLPPPPEEAVVFANC